MENKSDINDNKNKMPNYDKNDIGKCMENFKIIIENSNDLPNLSENIIELSINGGLGENCLRGIAWKILLKYYSIDSESSIKTWIDQTKGYWNAGYEHWRWSLGIYENDLGIERTNNNS